MTLDELTKDFRVTVQDETGPDFLFKQPDVTRWLIEAEQEAQKMQFVLQKEKQEAERKRVEAQGIADYQRIINESLSDRQLQYEQIKAMKELAGSQNSKIIVMPSKGGAPLLINAQ